MALSPQKREGKTGRLTGVKPQCVMAPKGMSFGDFRDALRRWKAGDEEASEEPVLSDHFYTLEEVAQISGRSVRTIRRRISDGKLLSKTIREGGRERTLVFLWGGTVTEWQKAFRDRELPWPAIVKALLQHYGEVKLKHLLDMNVPTDDGDRGSQRIYAWIRGEMPNKQHREKLLSLTDDEGNGWWIGPEDV